jgi:hypothetical protein
MPCFLRVRAAIFGVVVTTDKVHLPCRSMEEAGAFARNVLLVLPSVASLNLRQAGLRPKLTANFDGASSLDSSARE